MISSGWAMRDHPDISAPDAILIAGPTASGKSALALRLATVTDGVIINADSMQVYRDLAIITARPSDAEMALAPHRLYGYRDAMDICSVQAWVDDAMVEVRLAWDAGQTPIIVGGTGMYLRALIGGLAVVPDIPPDIRERVRHELAAEGAPALHDRLAQLDPVMAGKLAPGDSQRVARALEVIDATGVSLAEWQARTAPGPLAGRSLVRLVVDWPRDQLYARIEARFDQMLASGVVEEVMRVYERRLDPALPVMKALGVPELIAWQTGAMDKTGAMDRDDAIRLAKRDTRRFAKRQMTWFRNQFGDWDRLSGNALSDMADADLLTIASGRT